MSENKEQIEIANKLTCFAYPFENFSVNSNHFFSYILGKHDFYHNGIHIDSNMAVRAVADGTVLAYRYIDDYKIKDFDIDNAEFPSEYMVLFSFKSKLNDIYKYFEKNEQGNFVLKDCLKQDKKKKQDAYKFINKIYSDSFVLLRHEVENRANEKIQFFSLYNHLKPLKNMTVEQKLNILFYSELKIKVLKPENYSEISGTDKGNNKIQIPSEMKYVINNEYECITWTLNDKKYKGYISKDKIRSLKKHKEIKRPIKPDDKSGDNYLKEDQYQDRFNSLVPLYSTDNTYNDRLVVYLLPSSEEITIGVSDFREYVNNNKDSVKVSYNGKINYLYLKSKEGIKEAFEYVSKELHVYSVRVFINKGIFLDCVSKSSGSKQTETLKMKNGKTIIPRVSTPCVQLESKFEINGSEEKQLLNDLFIPCETKVEGAKSKFQYINWSYNYDNKTSLVDSSFLRDKYKETKRYLHCWEEKPKAELTDYLSRYSYKNDKILIYDSGVRSERSVIASVPKETEFTILNREDFILNYKYLSNSNIKHGDENKDLNNKGIYVQYDGNKVGYIYLGWENAISQKYRNYEGSHGQTDFSLDVKNNIEMLFDKEDEDKNDVSIIGNCRKDVNNFLLSIDSKNESFTKNFDFFELKFVKDDSFRKDYTYNSSDKEFITKKRNQILGYTGYSIADIDKEKEDNKEIRIQNEDATSLHFEVFCEKNAAFLRKTVSDYKKKSKDEVHFPCYFKANKNCELTVGQGKLTTKTEKKDLFIIERFNQEKKKNPFEKIFKKKDTSIAPFNLNFDASAIGQVQFLKNTCFEIIEKGFVVDNEFFYKLKKVAEIVDFENEEYINKVSVEWDKSTSQYYSKEKKEIELNIYNYENNLIEGRTIPFYPDIPYFDVTDLSEHEKTYKASLPENVEKVAEGVIDFKSIETDNNKKNEDELKLRRLKFYYLKQDNLPDFYIKQATIEKFVRKKNKDSEKEYVFVYDSMIFEDEIFEEPKEAEWISDNKNNTLKLDLGDSFSYEYKKISEYDSFSEKHKVKNTWLQVENKYYINERDVKEEIDGKPLGTVYYDNWNDFFTKIILDGYKYDEKKEKRNDFLKKINLDITDANKSIRQAIRDNSDKVQNLYFERETEWSDSEELTKAYVDIDKNQKKEIEGYRKDLGFITDDFCTKTEFNKINTYFQPIAFLNHLDKVATPSDFNPYLREKINIPYNNDLMSNPGFMPKGITSASFTQEFNRPYASGYWHEGVDIAITKRTPILCGVKGIVVFEDDKQNYSYGCFIVIQALELYEGKCRYYLLGHLDRTMEHKKLGEHVLPNEIVGYVGNTGHCGTSYVPKSEWNQLDYNYGNGNLIGNNHLDYRAEGYGAHLHLQMYLSEDLNSVDFIKNHYLKTASAEAGITLNNMEIVNPFKYTETYKNEK